LSTPDAEELFGALPDLPRDESGPVFAEPWQAQAFALALQLHEQGAFAWTEWADALSRRVKAAGPGDDGSRYYEHWLATLEDMVLAKQLAGGVELAARKDAWEDAYRHTPHGRPVALPGNL
jgi:nitrile hydratase accessory protein